VKGYSRSIRVAEILKIKISEIIMRKINDPRIASITITNVTLSNDLRHAKIFFSMIGNEEEKRESIKAMQKATNYIKSIVGNELGLRYVPDMRFEFDDLFQESLKIHDLLDQIEKNGLLT